jgi:hypothetical protein
MKLEELQKILNINFLRKFTDKIDGTELELEHPVYSTKDYLLVYVNENMVNYFSSDNSDTFSIDLTNNEELAKLISKVNRLDGII